jgi:hypothetical protein
MSAKVKGKFFPNPPRVAGGGGDRLTKPQIVEREYYPPFSAGNILPEKDPPDGLFGIDAPASCQRAGLLLYMGNTNVCQA